MHALWRAWLVVVVVVLLLLLGEHAAESYVCGSKRAEGGMPRGIATMPTAMAREQCPVYLDPLPHAAIWDASLSPPTRHIRHAAQSAGRDGMGRLPRRHREHHLWRRGASRQLVQHPPQVFGSLSHCAML